MALKIFFITGCILLVCITSEAQTLEEMMNDTAVVSPEQAPAQADPIMSYKWNQFHTKAFTLNFGIALILDHSNYGQDSANIRQVGVVNTGTAFRGERLVFSGNLLFFKNPWRYMISLNYNGMDQEDGSDVFSVIDLNVEIPVGKKDGWFTIGKQKEGVGFEYILPGTQAMFMERGSGVPAFVRQRNIGIRFSNSILNHRMTYTVGVFNNWIEKRNDNAFSGNGTQVTARVTGLPIYESDRQLMHLGVGYRYTQATNGDLGYKGRPEDNIAPYYYNTGSFSASGANTVMFEWLGVKGPVSLMAEYMNNYVNSTAKGNPVFNYFQVAGSWFITGENRRYNKQVGATGKLIPKKNFWFTKGHGMGAFELDVRYTNSNFSEVNLDGGKFRRFSTGLGWYPNAHFRFEVNYGYGTLNKSDEKGHADFWQFRMQFEL